MVKIVSGAIIPRPRMSLVTPGEPIGRPASSSDYHEAARQYPHLSREDVMAIPESYREMVQIWSQAVALEIYDTVRVGRGFRVPDLIGELSLLEGKTARTQEQIIRASLAWMCSPSAVTCRRQGGYYMLTSDEDGGEG